jgi:hypothetical protein
MLLLVHLVSCWPHTISCRRPAKEVLTSEIAVLILAPPTSSCANREKEIQMNYEKLDVDRFITRVQNKEYAGLTGARRAIGKANWSDKDKKRAHEFADKFFGANSAVAAKATRTPKTRAPKAEKAEKAPKAVRRARKAADSDETPATPQSVARTPVPTLSSAPRVMQGDDPSTVRAHAASSVIAAYRNTGPLNVNEQRAYDIATVEYAESARESARRIVEMSSGNFPPVHQTPPSAPVQQHTAPQYAAPPPLVPPAESARIETPSSNGHADDEDQNLSPEVRAQHERLRRASASAAAAAAAAGTPRTS